MCVKWTVEIPKTPVNGQFTAYPFKFDCVRHEISAYMPQIGTKREAPKLSRSARKFRPVPSRSGTGTQRRQADGQLTLRLHLAMRAGQSLRVGHRGAHPGGANRVSKCGCSSREGRAQARRGTRAPGQAVIVRDFGFRGNKAANKLRNYHDHGPDRDDARTNRTEPARAARRGGGSA